MEIFLKILLAFHILSGFTALTTGCIAMIVVKGGKVHRLFGKIFFYSMLAVTASALIISVIKHNQFLFLIAIFSFYNNYMGYRAVKNKSLQPSQRDWAVLFLGAVNTFFMIYAMNVVLIVFGLINLTLVIRTCRTYIQVTQKRELSPLSWLKYHIGMMMGAYTATITAFVVVNSGAFEFLELPYWLPWFLPAAVLTPLSIYFTRKYTGRKIKKVSGN